MKLVQMNLRAYGPFTNKVVEFGDVAEVGTPGLHIVLGANEAGRLGPAVELGARVIEAARELDQHVERHQQTEDIDPALVVDDVLDGHEHAPGGQPRVGLLDEQPLLGLARLTEYAALVAELQRDEMFRLARRESASTESTG